MSSPNSIDSSPLDSSACCILAVSSSLSCAVDLIDRVKALREAGPAASTSEASASTSPPTAEEVGPRIPRSGLGESARIPWTISNKYYSADVHFTAHTVTGLAPHTVRNVPAVIFVWPKGEAYKHHVERLAEDMSGYEPEVSLAVRVAPSGRTEDTPSEFTEDDDEDDIDAYLASNGFEFIDVSESPGGSEDGTQPFSQGIPGLPRVLDALSTIMWPSMQAHARPKSGLPGLAWRDFDWAQSSQDDLSPVGKLARQEMEELTTWLEEDIDVSRDDPWRPPSNSAAMPASPTGMDAPEFPDSAKEFGFEDDFTAFVSAPRTAEAKGEEEDDLDDSFESPRLGLPDSSPLYLSLGSGLDLREAEEEIAVPSNDEDDVDMPTDMEIEEVHSRIFGGSVRSSAADAVSLDAGDTDAFDMAPFDLTRVMSALEGMKAEIASMEDEGAKRKAAASVAISLVYGLQTNASADS